MSDIIFSELDHQVGCVTLDRPAALNALTQDMCNALDQQLIAWAQDPKIKAVIVRAMGDRAFCAGGDIRRLHDAGLQKDRYAYDFFADEYRMNQRIHHFSKPYIALLDGITLGGGVGISVHGSHRIVTEKTTFAMPETGIGFFPDVGGSYFLPRCPGQLGIYLGLTGTRIKGADCLYAGIGTHFIPSHSLNDLVASLSALDYGYVPHQAVDHCLKNFIHDAGFAPLQHARPDIDACFDKNTIEEIIAALTARNDEWGTVTLEKLKQCSPTSLKVTLHLLRLGKNMDYDACMQLELAVSQIFMQHSDFFEGVRARIIDKDQTPHWQPATLATVTPDQLKQFFPEE